MKVNETMKKLLSYLLVLSMVLSYVPMPALADAVGCAAADCTGTYVDGICNECGVECSHNYAAGVCAVCGMKEPQKPTCGCETRCAEGAVSTACEVCQADWNLCIGKEQETPAEEPQTVTIDAWSWVDEWEIIDAEINLATLPTVMDWDNAVSFLPAAIELADGTRVEVCGWECGDFAVAAGTYTFTAVLPQGYAVAEGAELKLTVKMGEVEQLTGHQHCVCGDGTNTNCNHLQQPWTAWDGSKAPSGNVYLTNDIADCGFDVAEDTIICLNGHTITAASGYSALNAKPGVTLTITDCKGSGKVNGRIFGQSQGGVVDSTIQLYNGTVKQISGINSYIYGGKVDNPDGSAVNSAWYIYIGGGTITGSEYGVKVGRDCEIHGGTIFGTKAGVYVENHDTVTLNGGSVSGTTADLEIGCVYTQKLGYRFGKVTIGESFSTNNLRVTVTGDYTPSVPNEKFAYIKGAESRLSQITSVDGYEVVYDQTADEATGKICMQFVPPVVWGADEENLTNGGSWDDAVAYIEAASANTTIYVQLQEDVSTEQRLDIGNRKTVTLDLQTYTLTKTTEEASDNSVIYVYDGSNLTLTGTTGKITHASGKKGCGVIIWQGSFTMNGGIITGNTVEGRGSGVDVYDGGSFTMTGGKITGNKTVNSTGGGIYANGENASVIITGGEISNNTIEGSGGGICIVNTTGTTTLKLSGEPVISGNTANKGYKSDLYLSKSAFVTIAGTVTWTNPVYVMKDKSTDASPQFTQGWSTQMSGKDPTNYFATESSGRAIYQNSDAEACIGNLVDRTITITGPTDNPAYGTSATLTAVLSAGTGTITWSEVVGDDGENHLTLTPNQNGTCTVTADKSGTFTVQASVPASAADDSGSKCYAAASATYEIFFTKKSLDPSAFNVVLPQDPTYDGNEKSATVSAKEDGLTEADYDVKYYKLEDGKESLVTGIPKDAGTYVVKAVLKGERYSGTIQLGRFTIQPQTVTITAVPTVEAITYGQTLADAVLTGGTAAKDANSPAVSGKFAFADGNVVPTVADSDNTHYTVKFTPASDNYVCNEDCTVTVTVDPIVVDIFWSNTNPTYNGTVQCPTATVANRVGNDDLELTVTGGGTTVGNYTATVTKITGTAVNNYTLPEENARKTSFTIAPKTVLATATVRDKEYDGTNNAEVTNVSVAQTDLHGTDTITITGVTATFVSSNIGRHQVIIDSTNAQITGSGRENYKVVIDQLANANITKKTLNADGLELKGPASMVYDGQPKTATAVINVNGTDVSFNVNYFDQSGNKLSGPPTDAGTYTVKVDVDSHEHYTFNDAKEWDFIITPKPVNVTVSAKDKTYDGTTNAELEFTYDTTAGTISGITGSFADKNVGTAKTVNITKANNAAFSNSNYTIGTVTSTATASITAKTLTITPTSNQSKSYGAEDPTLEYTHDGLVGDDTISGQLGRNEGETVGSYAITQGTLAAGGNYTINFTEGVEFVITRAPINPTISINKEIYDGTPVRPEVTGKPEDGTVAYEYKLQNDPDDTYSDTAPSDAGSYTVRATISETANYQGKTVTAHFTIKPKDISEASIELKQGELFYTGLDQAPDIDCVTIDGLTITTADYDIVGNTGTNVGVYELTIEGKKNFKGTATAQWKIVNNWEPTEFTSTSLNESGWVNTNFTVTPYDGYFISTTDTDAGQWKDVLTFDGETGEGKVTFYLRDKETKAISKAEELTYMLDRTPPTGQVEFKERTKLQKVLNTISFDLFYKDEVVVQVTSDDNLSGVATVEYYESDRAMTDEEVKAITAWNLYPKDSGVSVTLEDTKQFVYIIRITDVAGNVTYLSTDGAEYDTTAPAVSGIENGKTYYTTQTATVTDKNLKTVTLDGEAVTSPITLEGNKEATYIIEATDKAGNEVSVTVSMQPIASLSVSIDSLDTGNVTSDNSPEVSTVLTKVNQVLDLDAKTEEERAELEAIQKKAQDLLEQIADAAEAIKTEDIQKVKDTDETNVKLEDKEDLIKAKQALEEALDTYKGNYTTEENADIQKEIHRLTKAIEIIEQTEAVISAIALLPDSVEPDLEEKLEKAIRDAKAAFDKLNEHQKSLMKKEDKEKLERLFETLTDYEIVSGSGSRWVKDSSQSLTFTANGPARKFKELRVDDKVVASTNYTYKEGSTIVTLNSKYLQSLSIGKHTIQVVFTDGATEEGTFRIYRNSGNPLTADNSQIMLLGGVMVTSLLCMAMMVMFIPRKKGKYEQ